MGKSSLRGPAESDCGPNHGVWKAKAERNRRWRATRSLDCTKTEGWDQTQSRIATATTTTVQVTARRDTRQSGERNSLPTASPRFGRHHLLPDRQAKLGRCPAETARGLCQTPPLRLRRKNLLKSNSVWTCWRLLFYVFELTSVLVPKVSEETQTFKSKCCVAFRDFVHRRFLGLSSYDVIVEACGRRRIFCVGKKSKNCKRPHWRHDLVFSRGVVRSKKFSF